MRWRKEGRVDTDSFIRTLAAEGARKPMPRLSRQVVLWAAMTLVWLAAMLWHDGLRPDLTQKLREPAYAFELVLLALLGLSAALAALALSRPDENQLPWARFAPLGLMAAWAVTAWLDMGPATPPALTRAMNERHFDCVACIAIFSLPPGLFLFLLVRHGAPIRSAWAGGMAAGAVTAFAYLLMRLQESNDNPFHLLIWHALPVLALGLAGLVAGHLFLRWKAPGAQVKTA